MEEGNFDKIIFKKEKKKMFNEGTITLDYQIHNGVATLKSISQFGSTLSNFDIATFLKKVDFLPEQVCSLPVIDRIIFNDPATIVFWCDGSKTVVKTSSNDIYNPEIGVAMAILKKIYGDSYYRQLCRAIANNYKEKKNEE